MSWFNPSQDEAEEEYYSAKSKYTEAANQKYASEKAEANYIAERNSAKTAIQSCQNDKINFEKRIKDIEKIIACFEGRSFFTDIPGSITNFNKSSVKVGQSYSSCIRCDDVSAADLSQIFMCKSVEIDSNSNSAFTTLKNEKIRLEQAVENIKSQLANLSSQISTLTGQINACNAEQASLNRTMWSSAYDMSHYKRYM